jgi:hypothetical protein
MKQIDRTLVFIRSASDIIKQHREMHVKVVKVEAKKLAKTVVVNGRQWGVKY